MASALHHWDTVTVRLMKYLLGVSLVTIAAVLAAWFWLLHTESGAEWAWSRATAAMDGNLSGEFSHGDFARGIQINNLKLSLTSFELVAESTGLAVRVGLAPLQLNVSGVRVAGFRFASAASSTDEQESLDIESLLSNLKLPLRVDIADISVSEIELLIGDDAELAIEQVDASVFWYEEILLRQLSVKRHADAMSMQGRIELAIPQSINLAVDAQVEGINLQGDIVGDGRLLKLQNMRVNGDDIRASASAVLNLVDEVRANASVQVEHFNAGALTDVWPVTHPLAGTFDLEASSSAIQISTAKIQIEQTDTTLNLDATLDLEAATVSADVSWQELQWPLDTLSPDIRSSDASLKIAGVLDNWIIEGTVAVATADMPDGQFQIKGGGNQDRVALAIESGRVFGGAATGELEYSWRKEQRWSAVVQCEDVIITSLLPEWPGVLSGYVDARGTQRPFSVNATVRDVSGEIRGQALTANGSFAYQDEVIRTHELFITHADNEIFLDGSMDTNDGLKFRVSIDAIESYVEAISGGFTADGRLSRAESEPYLSLNLDSEELLIRDIRLSGVRVIDQRPEGAIAGLSLQADKLQLAGQEVSDIDLLATIRADEQTLRLSGRNHDSLFSLDINGFFEDWKNPLDSTWRGEMTRFSISADDDHVLQLQKAAAVKWSSERVSINEFCLSDETASNMCADFSRSSAGEVILDLQLQQIPLTLLEYVVHTGLKLDQHVSGSLNWHADPASGATGTGELELSAGSVKSELQPSLSVPTGVGRLTFEITDGELLSATTSIPMPGIGAIDADFKILDLSNAASSDIDGQIKIDMTDIAIAAFLSPLVDSLSGSVHADFNVAGTLSNPLLTGAVAVKNAAMSYRPMGLHLDQINLVGELTDSRAVELSGTFHAGEGYGEIVSSADYRDTEQAGIRFKIQGNNLRLVDVPDIRLNVNPDLEIAYNDKSLNINGSLLIPSARITPANLVESRVIESDDVVIVAGLETEEKIVAKPQSQFTYDGNLQVGLGDQVFIDLGIAKAKLTGSAVFDWQGAPLPMADGRYDLSGSVKAFGQVLDITEGVIRFANVPANEPVLRIRAERQIYGNSHIKHAGVLVAGAVSNPTIEAYTHPLTTEERALTLLVTGSDFDYEQGVGAIDFGTYVAPRLFVSYGVGIFDRENVISARYDLTKGFGIKASSGDKDSGIDLNYRFEN